MREIVWETQDGRRLTMEQITDSHLTNIILMLQRRLHKLPMEDVADTTDVVDPVMMADMDMDGQGGDDGDDIATLTDIIARFVDEKAKRDQWTYRPDVADFADLRNSPFFRPKTEAQDRERDRVKSAFQNSGGSGGGGAGVPITWNGREPVQRKEVYNARRRPQQTNDKT
jgi:hypothetical protein